MLNFVEIEIKQMKAQDLRIGNYIYNIGDMMTVVCTDVIHDINIQSKSKPRYYPIPLTEDWLLKFGFEFINQKWPLKIKDPYIWQTSIKLFADGFYYLTIDGKKISDKIEYTHQLQNLFFALTNHELIIK